MDRARITPIDPYLSPGFIGTRSFSGYHDSSSSLWCEAASTGYILILHVPTEDIRPRLLLSAVYPCTLIPSEI